jgi:hypothetical protein
MNVSIIFMDNCCIFNLTYIHDKSTFHRSLGPADLERGRAKRARPQGIEATLETPAIANENNKVQVVETPSH